MAIQSIINPGCLGNMCEHVVVILEIRILTYVETSKRNLCLQIWPGQSRKSIVDMCWSTSLHCFNFKIPNCTIIVVACFFGGQMKCLWCWFTIKNCYLWEKLFLCIMGGKFLVYVGRVMWIFELLEYGPLGSLKEKLKCANPLWSLV